MKHVAGNTTRVIMRTIQVVGAVWLLSSFTACVTQTEKPPAKLAEGCLLNSDCEAPLVCVFRRCSTQCVVDLDCTQEPRDRCQAAESSYSICIPDCDRQPCPTGFICGTDKRCRKECTTSADCLNRQVCISNQCVSPLDVVDGGAPVIARCELDSQCNAGEVCRRNGTCGPQCLATIDCATGQACVSGRCNAVDAGTVVSTDAGCLYNSNCGGTQVCRNGVCGIECREPRDCASGLVCTNDRCVPSTPNDAGTCTFTSDCTSPLACLGGACRPECRLDVDCASGFQCTGTPASCQRIGGTSDGGACLYTSECRVGQRCANGSCVAECATQADCASGLACSASGRCVLPQSPDSGVRGCLYSSDCVANERCSPQGLCIPECVSTRDCALPQVCVSGGCRFPSNDGGVCVYNSQCPGGQRCAPTGQCVAECIDSRDCVAPRVCLAGACQLALPDAGAAGVGTACVLQSTCTPFGLICGAAGVCVVQCVGDTDCPANQGQCCRANRCLGGTACFVAADAGTVDAGTSGLDGGCRANIDCLDSDFCNGDERCVTGRCVAGTNPCDDSNPCTIDSCSSSLRQCSYSTQAIDADNDGHYPRQCGGGADDCDDSDPFTYPGTVERCDFRDNNCNGAVDESLWVEVPGARGSFSSGNLYPPGGNTPSIARVGNDVLVAAGSNGLNGTIDAYRLNATDFSLVAGPTTLTQSTTPWALCNGTSRGRQALRPIVSTDGVEFAVASLTASFTNSQATCLQNDAFSLRSAVSFIAPTLAMPFTQTLISTPPDPNNYVTDLARYDYDDLDRASLAFSPSLNRFVGVWAEERPVNFGQSNPRALYFATVSRTQAASTSRLVWGVNPNPARVSTGAPNASTPPRVGVGSTTVLFAWSNEPAQPINSRHLRWVLYDSALTSVVAGPFSYVFSTGSPYPHVDDIVFDGTNYRVVVNPQVDPVGSDGLVRVLSVNQSGAVVSDEPIMGSSPTNAGTPQPFASQHVGFTQLQLDGGSGFAMVGSQDSRLRLATFPTTPDGGVNIVSVDLGTSASARSDFVVVPLEGARVGVVWSDGDLKKTVFKCGP